MASQAKPEKGRMADFLYQNRIDSTAAASLLGLPPHMQAEVTATPITGAGNPSQVLLSRIARVRQRALLGQRSPSPVAAKDEPVDDVDERLGEESSREFRPPRRRHRGGRRLRRAPEPTPCGRSPSTDPRGVEEFLRRHQIDEKACDAVRALPLEAQLRLMEKNLTQFRNPSAFLFKEARVLEKHHRRHDRRRRDRSRSRTRPALQRKEEDREEEVEEGYGAEPPPEEADAVEVAVSAWPQDDGSHDNSGSELAQAEFVHESVGDEAPIGEQAVFVLILRQGDSSLPNEIAITSEQRLVRVGRSPACDVVIPIYHISKTHAEFHLQGGPGGWALMMKDVSSNGTWLGRVAVEPGRFIEVLPGDLVSFLPPDSTWELGFLPPIYEVLRGDEPRDSQQGAELPAAARGPPSTVEEWLRTIPDTRAMVYLDELGQNCSLDHIKELYADRPDDFYEDYNIDDADLRLAFEVALLDLKHAQ